MCAGACARLGVTGSPRPPHPPHGRAVVGDGRQPGVLQAVQGSDGVMRETIRILAGSDLPNLSCVPGQPYS
jgi:hypothetical protein